ncbi:PKD domain-containing protein [Halomicrobium sp. ZPS1]|uniref:Glycoside hydrolase family 18 n=2 Tax=Halomicrobium mukohataei TaxID=57705 RepID=C7P113_HALMD|nr:glycoside hydrolase family 18 [Halomicrobium mukohataei DSM 12286]QCD67058.1 PKD domain-containing protein [Halomicrobium mukohataei]QFR21868.1 PKD domain-containing protein [Halomicrobium sp. ZPS1]
MLQKATALSALAVGASATATAADCSGVSEWDASATYNGGDQVTYDGALWTAEWWTSGTQPAEDASVWTKEGACGDTPPGDGDEGTDCSEVSAWESDVAYTGGDQVTYDDSLWTAEWWTKGTEPAESENVWTLEGPCGDGGGGGGGGGDENQSPDASFTVSPSSPEPDEEVTLDASGSSDPDGDSLSYEWEIETVGTVEGAENSLTFDEAGDYEVTLTVTDAEGASSSVTETLSVAEAPDPPSDEFKVIGYYPGWKATPEYDYYPEDIPFDKVTHVQYAFLGVDADEAVPTIMSDQDRENLERFKELKDGAASDTKITLSIGGWADSTGFSEIAATESNRQSFADRCVEILRKYNLDGIDIDWEHPGSSQGKCQCGSNEDYETHVDLLQALRDTLDAAAEEDGKYYELSVANGGSDWNAGGLRHGDIGEICDFASIMAYDFTGSWMDVVGQNAPLYGDSHPTENSQYGETYTAQYFVEYSVDKLYAGDHGETGYWPGQWEYPPAEPAEYDELVLGLPFYGRGFNGTEMYGNYSGLPEGTWHDQLEDGADPTGAFDFGDLEENIEGADGWTKKRHDPGAVPYIVNEDEETIISYDDEQAIEEKVEFAKERGMQGVMFWELSQDWNQTLLDAINRTA